MSRLELLIEQTSFLLEKQKEAKEECSDIFSDFLAFVESKLSSSEEESEEAKSLEKVHDFISGQAQQLVNETDEDIAFLEEQVKALQDVSKIEDPQRAHELLNLIIDEEEELAETEQFKQDINEEATIARQNLQAMVDDVKNALNEGSTQEVELLLESMAQEIEQDDEEDPLAQEEEESENRGGGCCSSGSCPPQGCDSCSSGSGPGDGFDIFSSIDDYDQELARDLAEEERKKEN